MYIINMSDFQDIFTSIILPPSADLPRYLVDPNAPALVFRMSLCASKIMVIPGLRWLLTVVNIVLLLLTLNIFGSKETSDFPVFSE